MNPFAVPWPLAGTNHPAGDAHERSVAATCRMSIALSAPQLLQLDGDDKQRMLSRRQPGAAKSPRPLAPSTLICF
jgi:hypothetical protein